MNLSTCTENHGYQNSQHSKSSVSEEQLLGLILLLSGFVVIPNFFFLKLLLLLFFHGFDYQEINHVK